METPDDLGPADWPHPGHGSTAASGPTLVPSQPFPPNALFLNGGKKNFAKPPQATAAFNVMLGILAVRQGGKLTTARAATKHPCYGAPHLN